MQAAMGVWSQLVVVFIATTKAAVVHPTVDHKASAGDHAVKSHGISALQRANSKTPAYLEHDLQHPEDTAKTRYFLPSEVLKPIHSIRCLEEKQRFPDRPCEDQSLKFNGPINLGHFPHWQDVACNSDNEFFCDPGKLLAAHELDMVHQRLQFFRERTQVSCGAFDANDDQHHQHWLNGKDIYTGRAGLQDFRPFNLAIVIGDEWPSNEMDAKSMDYFGRQVMTEWGLMRSWNGVSYGDGVNEAYAQGEQDRTCSNAAVLFVLPRYHQAFFTGPSCELLCASRGGPEIVAVTLAGLDRAGTAYGILSAIDEVSKALNVTTALSRQRFDIQTRWRGNNHGDMLKTEAGWVWFIRLAYVLVLAAAVFFVWAFVYFVMLPKKTSPTRRSFADMNSMNARRDMQAFLQDPPRSV